MKKVVKLKENDIQNIVKIVLEQENDEWIKVTPERYLELMSYASYFAPGIANLPEFRGKKIWITGNLDLRGTPTKSLDGIKRIEGKLDISNTKISSIDGINVIGYVSDWDTPLRKIKEKIIKNNKIAEANVRREDDEWRLDTGYGRADDVAYAAHAVLEFIIEHNRIEKMTDEDSKRLVELTEMLENLQQKENEYDEQGKDLTDIHTDIEIAEADIEEIGKKMDIYHLIPDGNHYGMPSFEVIGIDDVEGERYCAATPEDMEDAAYNYVKEQVREGYSNFNSSFVENSIDTDEVVDYFRYIYENDVRESPESYFNKDDYKLSEEQENKITELEEQIAELEEQQNNLENEIEEPSEYSDAYDEVQEKIDALESQKEDIESDTNELTDEMVDDKIEELLNDVRRDPLSSLKDYGIDDYENFIDEDEFIKSVIDADGIGIMNGYDSSYDVVMVNNEEFYVMRLE